MLFDDNVISLFEVFNLKFSVKARVWLSTKDDGVKNEGFIRKNGVAIVSNIAHIEVKDVLNKEKCSIYWKLNYVSNENVVENLGVAEATVRLKIMI